EEGDQSVVVFEASHARPWQQGVIDGTACSQVPVQETVGGEAVVVDIESLVGEVLVAIPPNYIQIMVVVKGGFIVDSRFKSIAPVDTIFFRSITHPSPIGSFTVFEIIH